MNSTSIPQIIGDINQIKEADKMIQLSSESNDPVNQYMTRQYQSLKKEFIKQLLADLISSNINYKDLEPFFLLATSYLKKADEGESLANELKINLSEVERLMAA